MHIKETAEHYGIFAEFHLAININIRSVADSVAKADEELFFQGKVYNHLSVAPIRHKNGSNIWNNYLIEAHEHSLPIFRIIKLNNRVVDSAAISPF